MIAVFAATNGNEIAFDDFTADTEYDSVWVEMCPHRHNKYKNILGLRCSDKGEAQGVCGVQGCNNEADYYVDFKPNEIKITVG